MPETDRTFQLIAGRGVGEINVPGLSDIGTDRTNPKAFLMNNYQWADNLFFTQGRHSLKLGGSFERFQYNGLSESRTRGLLRFNSLADLLRFRVRDLQGATPDSDRARLPPVARRSSTLTMSSGLTAANFNTDFAMSL